MEPFEGGVVGELEVLETPVHSVNIDLPVRLLYRPTESVIYSRPVRAV